MRVELLLEPLVPQYIALPMGVTPGFGARCGMEGYELKYASVETIWAWARWCEEGCSSYALLREGNGVVTIPSMKQTRSESHFLPSFSTEGAEPEKTVTKDLATEYSSSVFVGDVRKLELLLKLCDHWWLRDRLEKGIFRHLQYEQRTARDTLFEMVEYDALLSQSTVVSESVLRRKKRKNG